MTSVPATQGATSAPRRLSIRGADWPLVGRDEELDLLRGLRRDGRSAVVGGSAGVGKSRVARAALAEAAAEGWATLTVRGGTGLTGLPLGPLRTVLGVASSSDLVHLMAEIEGQLLAMRSGVGLLVYVDDAQDLDDTSAALLHQLVAAGAIVALLTTRSGTRPPDSLTHLWKDGQAGRIELQHLSRSDTVALLEEVLGLGLAESTADRIWQITGGSPLYLKEVVLASLETGALQEVDGEWRWRGDWAADARLQEIVASRIGRLDADELTAIEMLALAGPLPLALISSLTCMPAVEALERRGLVVLMQHGDRLEVAIAHPVHVEVVRSGIPALRQRAVRRTLAEALSRTECRRADDELRLACWSLEAGITVDPVSLARGADASLFQVGRAISAKLDEILPGTPSAQRAPAEPILPNDPGLAVRMARAAYERTGRVAEGIVLAQVLAWTGATDSAEGVLAELAGRVADIDDRLRLTIVLAWTRFWCRADVDEAIAVLVEAARAAEAAGSGADRALVADVYQTLAGIELNVGRPAAALESAGRSAAVAAVDLSDSVAAPAAAGSLAYLGRCEEAIGLVDVAVAAAMARGDDHLGVPSLLFARAAAMARVGRLGDAYELAESCRAVALANGSVEGTAVFDVLAGEILLRQGRPATAGRMFRDAAGLFAEQNALGYRPWALYGLARARALAGDERGAEAALAEGRRHQAIPRHYELSRFLAEAAVHAVAGRAAAALDAAEAGAAWAGAAGMPVDEAIARHAGVLIEPSVAAAERLATLAELADGDYTAALAAHAGALVAVDPAALIAASARLEELCAWGIAAEAAAAAAGIYGRRNQHRLAESAARAARSCADRCEGRLVLVESLTAPTRLTQREFEVATLIASGHSGQEIADRLFLSRRTVESHLYHAYSKLGVSGRAALSEALRGTAPPQ